MKNIQLIFDFKVMLPNETLECIVTIRNDKLETIGQLKVKCDSNTYYVQRHNSTVLPSIYPKIKDYIQLGIESYYNGLSIKRKESKTFWIIKGE